MMKQTHTHRHTNSQADSGELLFFFLLWSYAARFVLVFEGEHFFPLVCLFYESISQPKGHLSANTNMQYLNQPK